MQTNLSESLAGLIKITGITLLLVGLWILLAVVVPESFLAAGNLENLMRRTALYGILGVGVAFVIIGSGIDLSIGSLVCLSACLLGLFLRVDYVESGAQSVWEYDAQTMSVVLDRDSGYEVGDSVWFEADRRNRGLLTIERIEPTDRGRERLFVAGGLSRSRSSTDEQPVAKINRSFQFQQTADNQITLTPSLRSSEPMPKLSAKDRILFVHPEKSRRERTIESVGADQVLILNETINLEEGYLALPVLRRPVMSIPMAILSVSAVALLLGLIHGLLITRLNLQPFVVTLCGLMIYRGFSRWLTADQTVGFSEYADTLASIGTGKWIVLRFESGDFGIPYPVFVFAIVVVIGMILLNLTVWGRHLLAVGKNPEAARYSGVNTRRVILTTYMICALLTGIGGIMLAIDSQSIAPSSFGNFLELYAIAAAVLGGCSLRGGEGSILGVVIGTALMQTLYNAIILLEIPDTLQFAIVGGVILLGVTADELLHRFRRRRAR